jgi:hypothetical protein
MGKTSMIERRGADALFLPSTIPGQRALTTYHFQRKSNHSHIHTRIQASHGKAELSKLVIKTDDNGNCFYQIRYQIRVLMVPKFQK